jgi:long-chain acyl-CoA synthetase
MEDRHTVVGVIRTNASERPDQLMLVAGDRRATWSEVYRRSCQVAQALLAEGVGEGDRVAILDKNGIAYFEVLFGSSMIGAVCVAVNWRLAPPEMAAIIDDARAVVLVVHPEFVGCLDAMESDLKTVQRVAVLDDEGADVGGALGGDTDRRVAYEAWLATVEPVDPGFRGRSETVSMQLYTSGTTGLPKGVMLTNANFEQAIAHAGGTFQITDDTVSLVAMPLFHIGGSGWALCAMSRGGVSVIMRDVDPRALLHLVETERITEAFIVPAVLMMMLALPEIERTDFSSLRNVFYGASPISEDVLVRVMRAIGCGLTQVYGMTETTGAICSLAPKDHDPEGPRRHLLRSAGKPLDGVELRAVDPDTGDDVPPGTVGEIWTRSPYNMAGYWERPEETLACINQEAWLRTGDAGYLDPDGYLFLHDRVKDMIVTGGENVYPAEIENALFSHPAVADVAVIGVPDEKWGETVKAVVVLAPGIEPSPDTGSELISHSRERLAHYKCPTSVDFIDALPRNPSGKVLKRQLREPYWQGRERAIH